MLRGLYPPYLSIAYHGQFGSYGEADHYIIDYIIITKENTIKDVTVINRVKESDHRLLRCKVNFGIKIERAKLTKGKNGFRVNKAILKNKQDVFQLELRNKFQALASACEDIDSFNCDLITLHNKNKLLLCCQKCFNQIVVFLGY